MKKLAGIVAVALVLGFVPDKPVYDKPRKQPKLPWETPPGTVWLRDSLFIDKCEISNFDYLEFLYWIGKYEPDKYKPMLPDTLCDRHKLVMSEPYVEYYLRHPAFRDYPVIGVSYVQAVAYCEWRSRMVNLMYHIRRNKIKSDRWDTIRGAPELVRYRLPEEWEWCYAAAGGLVREKYPFGYRQLTDKDGRPVSNNGIAGSDQKGYTDMVAPVTSGRPNYYGLYQMVGNCSELIADSLIKGLNFETDLTGVNFRTRPAEYVIVDSTENAYDYKYTFRYQKPERWLSFRCVCEVKKHDK